MKKLVIGIFAVLLLILVVIFSYKFVYTGNTICTPHCSNGVGSSCGNDGCGGSCGTCPSGWICNHYGGCCKPQTCAYYRMNCGEVSDGCEEILNCGTCGSGQVCINNVCSSSGTGYMNISGDPAGAQVFIDGINRGITPLFLSDIPVGLHQIVVVKSGYNTGSFPNAVYAGQILYTISNLVPNSSNIISNNTSNNCTPQCSLKSCGSDGCGGSCGNCRNNQNCINSVCINSSTSNSTSPTTNSTSNLTNSTSNFTSPISNSTNSTSNLTISSAINNSANCEINGFFCIEAINCDSNDIMSSLSCNSAGTICCKKNNPRIEIKPDETTGPIDMVDNSSTICNGCNLASKCYPFGFRKYKIYCDENSSEFINEKTSDSICDNNFECDSDLCISGKCISKGLFEQIIDWFIHLFSGK